MCEKRGGSRGEWKKTFILSTLSPSGSSQTTILPERSPTWSRALGKGFRKKKMLTGRVFFKPLFVEIVPNSSALNFLIFSFWSFQTN